MVARTRFQSRTTASGRSRVKRCPCRLTRITTAATTAVGWPHLAAAYEPWAFWIRRTGPEHALPLQGASSKDTPATPKAGETTDSAEVAGSRPTSAVKNFSFRNMTRQDYFCLCAPGPLYPCPASPHPARAANGLLACACLGRTSRGARQRHPPCTGARAQIRRDPQPGAAGRDLQGGRERAVRPHRAAGQGARGVLPGPAAEPDNLMEPRCYTALPCGPAAATAARAAAGALPPLRGALTRAPARRRSQRYKDLGDPTILMEPLKGRSSSGKVRGRSVR